MKTSMLKSLAETSVEDLIKGDVVDFDHDSHSPKKGKRLGKSPQKSDHGHLDQAAASDEFRAKIRKAADEAGAMLENSVDPMKIGEQDGHQVPMVDHPREGQQDMDSWYASNMQKNAAHLPMVDHQRPGAGSGRGALGAGMSKGDTGGESSMELHEPSTASSYQDTQTLSRSTYELPEMSNHPVSGLPSVDAGMNEMFSEDDRPVEQQMKDGKRPLWSSQSVGQAPSGGSDIGENDVYGHDVSSGSGALPGDGTQGREMVDHPRPGSGGMSKSAPDPYGERQRFAHAAAQRAQFDLTHRDVAPEHGYRGEAIPQGQTWKTGFVTYSTGEDERIAKAMNEFGEVVSEPTLNWQAPLLQSRQCGLCKSVVPQFLTVCPCCGGSAHSGAPTGYGVVMEKSVADSVRGPQKGDLHFANGVIILTEE